MRKRGKKGAGQEVKKIKKMGLDLRLVQPTWGRGEKEEKRKKREVKEEGWAGTIRCTDFFRLFFSWFLLLDPIFCLCILAILFDIQKFLQNK